MNFKLVDLTNHVHHLFNFSKSLESPFYIRNLGSSVTIFTHFAFDQRMALHWLFLEEFLYFLTGTDLCVRLLNATDLTLVDIHISICSLILVCMLPKICHPPNRMCLCWSITSKCMFAFVLNWRQCNKTVCSVISELYQKIKKLFLAVQVQVSKCPSLIV